jgi:hypothetical protein
MSIDKYLLKYMQIYLENTDLRAAAQWNINKYKSWISKAYRYGHVQLFIF